MATLSASGGDYFKVGDVVKLYPDSSQFTTLLKVVSTGSSGIKVEWMDDVLFPKLSQPPMTREKAIALNNGD